MQEGGRDRKVSVQVRLCVVYSSTLSVSFRAQPLLLLIPGFLIRRQLANYSQVPRRRNLLQARVDLAWPFVQLVFFSMRVLFAIFLCSFRRTTARSAL